MDIGIIGSGRVGTILARHLAARDTANVAGGGSEKIRWGASDFWNSTISFWASSAEITSVGALDPRRNRGSAGLLERMRNSRLWFGPGVLLVTASKRERAIFSDKPADDWRSFQGMMASIRGGSLDHGSQCGWQRWRPVERRPRTVIRDGDAFGRGVSGSVDSLPISPQMSTARMPAGWSNPPAFRAGARLPEKPLGIASLSIF
jgi:hypothetical protein